MDKKEEVKKYIIEKYQISEQEFDETYEVYSNLINFLQDMDLVHEFNDKVDDVLTVDNDICMGIFLDIIKIKKIGLAMFLDYVYVLYTAMQDSSIVGSYLKAIKDFFDRLAFYSKDGADMLKEHVKNAFSYPLELVLVYKYEKVMNSKYVPDYYKIIIDLYKKIYKKYDALENGFMCYLLNESFDYFVLNESFKNDYEKVHYMLSLIYEDYDNFQDIVSLSGSYFKNHKSFDELYSCISVPKRNIM